MGNKVAFAFLESQQQFEMSMVPGIFFFSPLWILGFPFGFKDLFNNQSFCVLNLVIYALIDIEIGSCRLFLKLSRFISHSYKFIISLLFIINLCLFHFIATMTFHSSFAQYQLE